MNFLCKLLLWCVMISFLACGAKASPVCHEKADVYKLALADMQGTADVKWGELVGDGSCADVPAKYLFTLDTYTSDEFTRVVEMMAFGRRVYGLMTTLPNGIWLIQHNHPPQDAQLHDRFYNTWLMPNGGSERKQSCCNKQDCYPTSIRFRDGRYWAQRREDGKWLAIPADRLEQNQLDPRESPDYQSHACIAPPHAGDYVYCAVLGSGI